jgi:hypothetical protein
MMCVFIWVYALATKFTSSATDLRSNSTVQKDETKNCYGTRKEKRIKVVEWDLGQMEH